MADTRVPIYLGDEVSAAGWRLTGVDARACAPGDAGAALEAARAQTPLVMLSAALAVHVPAGQLRAAEAALAPLVLVLPDPQGEATLPDLAARLRSQLGMEA